VNELLRKALSEVFLKNEIRDPDLEGVVLSVSEVRASPDLRNAAIFVVPMGGGDVEGVVAALERNSRFLRGELAGRIELKFVPALKFKADTSFDTSAHIDELLRSPKVARDLS